MELNKYFFTEQFKYNRETGALVQNYRMLKEVSENDTGYSDLDVVDNMKLGTITEPSDHFIYAIGKNQISRHDTFSLSREADGGCKVIHTIDDGETFSYCAYPGFEFTSNGNLLYTSAKYLGRGVFGKSRSDESTKIVDEDVRNLSDLGIAVDDTVINLVDGSTATITAISTTFETNDTMEFSGGFSDSGSISDGDPWVVLNDTFADFGVSSSGGTQFSGQDPAFQWSRQIIDFYGRYYILNGNYISALNNAEDTFTEQWIELPSYHHAIDFDFNQQNILIGANYKEKGKLLLWQEGLGNSFLSIISLPYNVKSIKSYEAGWIVFAGRTIYYTNGYSLEKLSDFRDSDELDSIGLNPTGMHILEDKVLLNTSRDVYNRQRAGIHIYDISNGQWDYLPFITEDGQRIYDDVSSGGIFLVNGDLFASYEATFINLISQIRFGPSSVKSEATFYIPNDQKGVNGVDLYLGVSKSREYRTPENVEADVFVGIADGARQFFDRTQGTDDAGKNYVSVNPSYNFVQEGYLIKAISGDNTGEIVFVESVENSGFYVTPDFTNMTKSKDDYIVCPLKKLGEKTINSRSLQVPMPFMKGSLITGDFFLYIYINSNIPLEIRNIKFN